MSRDTSRMFRALIGIVVLTVLFFMVLGWWRDYRQDVPASAEKASVTETATPSPDAAGGETAPQKPTEASPADKPAAKPKYVVVVIEGLNFRPEPSSDSKPIRGLSEGEKLVLLETKDGWYLVRADDGTEGWVSADPQYAQISNQ